MSSGLPSQFRDRLSTCHLERVDFNFSRLEKRPGLKKASKNSVSDEKGMFVFIP